MRPRLDLFPTHGQPALAPWGLVLVTVFQFMEGLTDRQEAFAGRDRLAWKYALSLELTDLGFDIVPGYGVGHEARFNGTCGYSSG